MKPEKEYVQLTLKGVLWRALEDPELCEKAYEAIEEYAYKRALKEYEVPAILFFEDDPGGCFDKVEAWRSN